MTNHSPGNVLARSGQIWTQRLRSKRWTQLLRRKCKNPCIPLEKFRPNRCSVVPSFPLSKLGLNRPSVDPFFLIRTDSAVPGSLHSPLGTPLRIPIFYNGQTNRVTKYSGILRPTEHHSAWNWLANGILGVEIGFENAWISIRFKFAHKKIGKMYVAPPSWFFYDKTEFGYH